MRARLWRWLYLWAHRQPSYPYLYDENVMVDVLVHHQRSHPSSGCACGWRVLGASHAEHVAHVYDLAMVAKLWGTLHPDSGTVQ